VKELGKLTPYVRKKGGLVLTDRPQRKGSGNCLSKTQHCAKAQADVYSVTLAQCWNVMEEGQPQGEALDLSTSQWRP
jgi:hypothetical protein